MSNFEGAKLYIIMQQSATLAVMIPHLKEYTNVYGLYYFIVICLMSTSA